MTRRLECPLEGCHAAIEAETGQEVMAQVEEHATGSHPELELDDETVQSIRSGIRDASDGRLLPSSPPSRRP